MKNATRHSCGEEIAVVAPFPEVEQAPPRECKQLCACFQSIKDGVVESAPVQT
jgi:hypothetical protein